MGDLSKNFSKSEFRCKCNRDCVGKDPEMKPELIDILQNVRDHFGQPVRVTSGLRCPEHNRDVGGASKSKHKTGEASDIQVNLVPPEKVHAYIETLEPGGLGLYPRRFVHVDVRKGKQARWTG